MRRLLGVALALGVGALAWTLPADEEDRGPQPKLEVAGGWVMGQREDQATSFGLMVQAMAFPADPLGFELWGVPAGVLVESRRNRQLDGELGPLVSGYQHLGVGLVGRRRLDFVSPSTLNLQASVGWHGPGFEGSSDALLTGSWYASAGGELILGRPFVLGGRLWFLTPPQGSGTRDWMALGTLQGSFTLGLAF